MENTFILTLQYRRTKMRFGVTRCSPNPRPDWYEYPPTRRGAIAWLTGMSIPLGGLSFHTARKIRMVSSDGRPVPIQIDGDPAGHLPADVEVLPGSTRLLTRE